MRTVYIVIFLMIINHAYSMDALDVIKRMQQVYTAEKLEYQCKYELFKGHESNVAHESYAGYIYRRHNYVYQKIGQTELVFSKGFSIRINHEEQAIALHEAQKAPPLDINTEQALKECSQVLVEDKGIYYEIKLLLKPLSTLPFSSISMQIRKKDYHLQQLDLYYSLVQDFSANSNKSDLQQPHMKVTFGELELSPVDRPELFAFNTYLKKEDNILIPADTCTGYELIDNRVK